MCDIVALGNIERVETTDYIRFKCLYGMLSGEADVGSRCQIEHCVAMYVERIDYVMPNIPESAVFPNVLRKNDLIAGTYVRTYHLEPFFEQSTAEMSADKPAAARDKRYGVFSFHRNSFLPYDTVSKTVPQSEHELEHDNVLPLRIRKAPRMLNADPAESGALEKRNARRIVGMYVAIELVHVKHLAAVHHYCFQSLPAVAFASKRLFINHDSHGRPTAVRIEIEKIHSAYRPRIVDTLDDKTHLTRRIDVLLLRGDELFQHRP